MTITSKFNLPDSETVHSKSFNDFNLPNQSIDEDVLLGAFLISHLSTKCESCRTQSTPQWRKGWYSPILGTPVPLCNACGLKYHKLQYCNYCKSIYTKDEKMTSDKWLTCGCGRHVHTKCEELHGTPNVRFSCSDCKTGSHPDYLQRISEQSTEIYGINSEIVSERPNKKSRRSYTQSPSCSSEHRRDMPVNAVPAALGAQ